MYIPREDHNLQEHSMVIVKGENERLSGIRCHLFKGLLKLLIERDSRSKYGTKFKTLNNN